MKILMITPSLSKKWGGTTTSLMNFYKGLIADSSVECRIASVITPDEQGDIDEDILNNSDFTLFKTDKSFWRNSKQLNDFLKTNAKQYDLIWIHTLWTGATYNAAKYAYKYNIPYILTPHGMIEPSSLERKAIKKKLYWSLVEKKIFDRAAAIHCITEAESLFAKKLSNTTAFVIPNAVQQQPWIDKEHASIKKICFIGRFHEKKALDLLLQALSKVDDIDLLVAGGGDKEYEEYIYSLVEKLGLKDRVEFKGFADDSLKKWIYTNSAFLVLPSHTEGLSMVGLESVMHSTPVLTTKKCNFDEVEHYNAGMVMETNTPETIKANILKMFAADIKQMSTNSYKLANEKYSLDSVTNRMLKKLKEVI